MLYIFSNELDVSTQNLTLWLRRLEKEFYVIYTEKKLTELCLKLSSEKHILSLKVEDDHLEIDLEKDRFFYRRGKFTLNVTLDHFQQDWIGNFLRNEKATIQQFLDIVFLKYSKIETKQELNKLNVLKLASDTGLQIPNTLVATSKKELLKFYEENSKRIIIKPLYEGLNIRYKTGFLKTYTSKLSIDDINQLPEQFFPVLTQMEINKYLEVRSFYLKEDIYSMAIFSQQNKMTSTDFRNYDQKRPLKTSIFQLPSDIEEKIRVIFQKLDIDTGSVDLCFSKDKQFYFLEINPVGQYGMLDLCNYHLDKKIAEII